MERSWKCLSDAIAQWSDRLAVPLARTALFTIYAWFGLLKVLDVSPASPLVEALQEKTLSFIDFQSFFVVFGLVEVGIGVLFLIRGWERVALLAMVLHLVSTAMPLVMLPDIVWQGFLTPTIEGQYIIKNLALLALGVMLVAKTNKEAAR